MQAIASVNHSTENLSLDSDSNAQSRQSTPQRGDRSYFDLVSIAMRLIPLESTYRKLPHILETLPFGDSAQIRREHLRERGYTESEELVSLWNSISKISEISKLPLYEFEAASTGLEPLKHILSKIQHSKDDFKVDEDGPSTSDKTKRNRVKITVLNELSGEIQLLSQAQSDEQNAAPSLDAQLKVREKITEIANAILGSVNADAMIEEALQVISIYEEKEPSETRDLLQKAADDYLNFVRLCLSLQAERL